MSQDPSKIIVGFVGIDLKANLFKKYSNLDLGYSTLLMIKVG